AHERLDPDAEDEVGGSGLGVGLHPRLGITLGVELEVGGARAAGCDDVCLVGPGREIYSGTDAEDEAACEDGLALAGLKTGGAWGSLPSWGWSRAPRLQLPLLPLADGVGSALRTAGLPRGHLGDTCSSDSAEGESYTNIPTCCRVRRRQRLATKYTAKGFVS